MSIQSDIVAALEGITSLQGSEGARVYPEAAPQDTVRPMVIYVRKSREPLMALTGPTGDILSQFVFECYADSKLEALTVADDVRDAIVAGPTSSPPLLSVQYEVEASAEDYLPETMEYMEPVAFAFWHR